MYEPWKNVKGFLHSSQDIEEEFDDFLCVGRFQLRIDFSEEDASLNYEAITIRQLDLNSENLIFEPSIRRLVIRTRYYGDGEVTSFNKMQPPCHSVVLLEQLRTSGRARIQSPLLLQKWGKRQGTAITIV
jgi:hypothetical protein